MISRVTAAASGAARISSRSRPPPSLLSRLAPSSASLLLSDLDVSGPGHGRVFPSVRRCFATKKGKPIDPSAGETMEEKMFREYNMDEWSTENQDPEKVRFGDPDSDEPDDPAVAHDVPLISRKDFLNRPAVGFDSEFASLEDAGIVLSHLGHDVADEMYRTYLDAMSAQKSDAAGATSHDRAVHEIARLYQVSPARAAAVVKLGHAEERIREKDPDAVHDDLAKFTDEMARRYLIAEYGPSGKPPGLNTRGGIVERRTMKADKAPRRNVYVRVPEGVDVAALERQAAIREDLKRRKEAATRYYKPDVDLRAIRVDVDSEATRLLDRREKLETQKQVQKRQRWKFVAKIENTETKKAHKKKSHWERKAAPLPTNIIVEDENRSVRIATKAEVAKTSWREKDTDIVGKLLEETREAFIADALGRKAEDFGVDRSVPKNPWGGGVRGCATEEWLRRRGRWGKAKIVPKEEQKKDADLSPPPEPPQDGGSNASV